MEIKRLEISNFLSVEDITIEFDDCGLVLLDGWNYDLDRANGAGKTAIFNALSFALYDKLPRKITKSEILRHGTKSGYVDVTLVNHNTEIRVIRRRPSCVEFYVNGELKPLTESGFISLIGLSYDQFTLTMLTAQGATDKFIDKADTGKKDFILALMDMSFFPVGKKIIDGKIKKVEGKINEKKIELQGVISKIEAYKESIIDESVVHVQLAQYKQEIEKAKQEILSAQAVSKPDLSKFTKVEQVIQQKRNEYNQLKYTRKNLSSQLDSLKRQDIPFNKSLPDASCPACNVDLNIIGKTLAEAADQTALEKQHEDHRKTIQDDINGFVSQINDIDSKLIKEKEVDKLQTQLADKKKKTYADYEKANSVITDRNRVVVQRETASVGLENQLIANIANRKKVDEMSSKLKTATSDVHQLNAELEVLRAASSVYSTTGAPAYIMDSIIEGFNGHAEKYVKMVWPNATYELRSFSLNKKSKEQKAKFSELLIIDGRERSIGSLSGGEKRAFSLALDFALIDMMKQQFSINLNPFILDEPFNDLDKKGREEVVEVLKRISQDRQIWVVDHGTETKNLFETIVRVEKRSGITKIVS